ncbi:MAG: Stk1 family PASTA domain-containing Ser/Thr kinase [Hydrogeniiclostridium sp.]|nr:Stk1 family PASTA domain-containing Ser/Thr kinase [Clostridiales bacterium]
MDRYTGKRLDGRYEIHELIGVGGMANVYRARDTIDDRTVAIKILKDEYLGNEEFIRRFKNESKAIAVLSHPNIVKVYDVSFGDRIQYIVEEYIDGITLKDYLSQQKEIKWKEAIHFTIQILRALQHAHEKGIVHRDIKPQNIMLLQDGTIKVTDFGIARFSRSETRTMTGKTIGSVHYIAPEQARGDLTDEKADIYSVGVMLYEMVTGRLPFEADNAVSVAIMQLQADPKPPREINPSLPEGLEEITMKAMQKDPSQRYQSASEMLRDIEEFRRNPSISFQYKYFVDEKPTKYIDAINTVKSSEPPVYNDNYEYEEVVEKRKKKSVAPLIITGIAAAFLIVAVALGISTLLRGCESEEATEFYLEDLTGQMYNDVVNDEKYAGKIVFEKEEVQSDGEEAIGQILDQKPAGNMNVRIGTTVTLYVNAGGEMVEVPDVTNYSRADAESTLTSRNLAPDFVSVSDDNVEEGKVVRTDPAAHSSIAKGAVVTVYISSGPADTSVTIPSNIIGVDIETARQMLVDAGLSVGSVSPRDDTGEEEGIVVDVSPLPGLKVEKGTKVDLTYSSGKTSEKQLQVSVELPADISYDLSLKAYIDGTLVKEDVVNPTYGSGSYTLTFTGTEQQELTVELNGMKYRVYTLDFAAGTVSLKETYLFTDTSSQPPVSDTPSEDPFVSEPDPLLPITPSEE